jgi:hypothetical protein
VHRLARFVGVTALLALASTWAEPASSRLTEFCRFTRNLGPCDPYDHPYGAIGQDLRVAFIATPQAGVTTAPPPAATPSPPAGKLNTIRDVFRALQTCFAGAVAPDSTQELAATIRFSFTRVGDILGEPRFTYVQSGIPAQTKHVFEQAIGHALIACVPLPFTDSLGGALAGRPFSIRVVKPAKPPVRS